MQAAMKHAMQSAIEVAMRHVEDLHDRLHLGHVVPRRSIPRLHRVGLALAVRALDLEQRIHVRNLEKGDRSATGYARVRWLRT